MHSKENNPTRILRLSKVALTTLLMLLLQSVPLLAENSAPLRMNFEKWLVGPGRTFAGWVEGDATGGLKTVVTKVVLTGEAAHLEATYYVSAGDQSFIAEVKGSSIHGHITLNGIITEGWLEGAQIHVEMELIAPSPPHYQGEIRIMPASAD